jgi:hypothetical protein
MADASATRKARARPATVFMEDIRVSIPSGGGTGWELSKPISLIIHIGSW